MGAVENIITDNLPIWSSAIQSKSSAGRGTSGKRNLYGIKKLRELILDLAVRGLLVPQDPSDEPASVLLEKIAVERERLAQEGVIPKTKKSTLVVKSELISFLPKTWSWYACWKYVVFVLGSTSMMMSLPSVVMCTWHSTLPPGVTTNSILSHAGKSSSCFLSFCGFMRARQCQSGVRS